MRTELTKQNSYEMFGTVVIFAVVASVLISALFGESEMGSFVFWLKQSLYTLAIGGVGIAYCTVRSFDVLPALKADKKPNGKLLLLSACAVFFLVNFSTEVSTIFEDLIVKAGLNKPEVYFPNPTASQIFPYILCACVLPAVCEEVVFRGVIAGGLFNSLGRWKGALLSGALFALFHMNPAQTLHQFVFGAVLALVYYDSGSLWTSVLLHLFNNLLAVVLSYTVDKTGFYDDNFAVVLFVSAVMTAFFMWKYLRLAKNIPPSAQTANCNGQQAEQEKTPADLVGYALLAIGVLVCAYVWIEELLH